MGARPEDFEIVCAWCKARVKRDGVWVDGEPAPGKLLSHSICPACRRAEEATNDNLAAGDDGPEDGGNDGD